MLSGLETDPVLGPSLSDEDIYQATRTKRRRDLIAFWIFGLTNHFAFYAVLTAAYDILREDQTTPFVHSDQRTSSGQSGQIIPSSHSVFDANLTTNLSTKTTDDLHLQCNATSTGAILLAAILPALLVKLIFPMFLEQIPYPVLIPAVAGMELCSLLIVAFVDGVHMSLLGVGLVSFTVGVGETSFLSLTTFYDCKVVSMWASGIAGAAMVASLAYAGLRTLGLSSRNVLLTMVSVPILMMVTYLYMLTSPERRKSTEADSLNGNYLRAEEGTKQKTNLTLKEKLHRIPGIMKYMVPIALVYFIKYFINLGLFELLYFNGLILSPAEQYSFYMFIVNAGEFISSSTVNCFNLNIIWTLPVLQFSNFVVFVFQVFYRFIPSFYIVLAGIFWEGLVGGAVYAKAFHRIRKEIPEEYTEFCMGFASVAVSIGRALSGALAIPSHNAICTMNIKL